MALTFGKVPYPKHVTHIIWNNAWDDLGPRHNYGVVYHRMLGSLMGTEAYFEGGAAGLTHYGTGHPGDHDGELRMWCDPLTNRAPWASGRVIAPWGDGPAFVSKYGANAVNNDLIAIEISGGYNDPISDLTKDTVAALSSYWADQAKVPHDQYPLNPTTGLTYTYWHQEFTGPAEKICPGPVVMNATDDIISRTVAMLKAAQTATGGPTTVTYPLGFDEAICKGIWGNAYKSYQFDENGTISKIWLNEGVFSPLVYHFKDTSDGRELFAFASGKQIGRLNKNESFRVLEAA
jgi:hypothetical protein